MSAALPPIVDRSAWMEQVAELRTREKAHTREGDAVFCQGPFPESDRYREFMAWEDSPEGWPRLPIDAMNNPMRVNGRPIPQWSRVAARRSDDLGTS